MNHNTRCSSVSVLYFICNNNRSDYCKSCKSHFSLKYIHQIITFIINLENFIIFRRFRLF